MNTSDAMNLLTVIAQYDPTMMPADDAGMTLKASVWAKALRGTDYEAALGVVHAHYKRDVRPITVAIIWNGAHGGKSPHGEHRFTECNPVILSPAGDLDGRYEVWCRRCGHGASVYAETVEEAGVLRDTHQYSPPVITKPREPESTDWSEPRTNR